MAHFTTTPEVLLNTARDLFLSESFSRAFEFLRDCFDKESVSDDTIFQLLKGEVRIQPVPGSASNAELLENNDITEESHPEEYQYRQTAKEVLENYDFLVSVNDSIYQVSDHFVFDLSLIASNNPLFNEFKSREGELINMNDWAFTDHLAAFSEKVESIDINKDTYLAYCRGLFFIFDKFKRPFYGELCTVYDKPLDACINYAQAWDIEV